MRALSIRSVSIRSLRNISSADLTFGPRFNVLSGDNGQGKTNLLEAIYLVATSKSFRTSKMAELVEHGKELASVRAEVVEDRTARDQSVGLKHGSRSVRIDSKRPATLAAYAVQTPVVVFHPGIVALSTGGGGERRKLLDRIALYMAPASLADLESYERALRARQRVLQTRGIGARDLDDWEELIVRHGVAVTRARRNASETLSAVAESTFSRIAASGLRLNASYAQSSPMAEGAYRDELRARRGADLRRGNASVGPHRDDLALSINAHAVRGTASQGQHRAIVLALKLAEIDVVAEARGARPILLLDDVSSELDRFRTASLFQFLQMHEGQVFLTTTRPELIATGTSRSHEDRVDFDVVSGEIAPTESPSGEPPRVP